MNTLITLMKSRTVWVIVLMFVVGGTNAVAEFIPDQMESVIMGFLALLAAYFKLNPSQKY